MSGSYDFNSIPALDLMDTAMTAFLAIYALIIAFALICGIVAYILQALGMYTIAKRRGIHNPWLAWIPVGNMWILGSVSDQYQYVAKGTVRNRRKTLLGLTIALTVMIVLFYASVLGLTFSTIGDAQGNIGSVVGTAVLVALLYLALLAVAIVAAVFQYIALYDLFASSRPGAAVVFLVLGIVFGFLMPFFIFACRKKDGGMPSRRAESQPVAQIQESPVYVEIVTDGDFEPED